MRSTERLPYICETSAEKNFFLIVRDINSPQHSLLRGVNKMTQIGTVNVILPVITFYTVLEIYISWDQRLYFTLYCIYLIKTILGDSLCELRKYTSHPPRFIAPFFPFLFIFLIICYEDLVIIGWWPWWKWMNRGYLLWSA